VNVPAEIFRTYDIRGVVGRSLTPQLVRDIGRALGSIGRERGAPVFAVCRDGRLSGPELAAALADGLTAAGADVIDIGMAPTPLAYFAAHHLGTGSCVAVSGSHNPPEYNGLKIVVAGDTLYGDEIQDIRKRIEVGLFLTGSGKRTTADVLDAYVGRIAGDVKIARPFHIAVDCGNGVAGMLAPRLYRRLGCKVTELYCEVDGTFPNHHPDPAQPKNLVELINTLREGTAELGLAFDGDGDRLGVVTKDGEVIFPDRQLMLLAKDVLARNPGAEIIYDVKSTRRAWGAVGSWRRLHDASRGLRERARTRRHKGGRERPYEQAPAGAAQIDLDGGGHRRRRVDDRGRRQIEHDDRTDVPRQRGSRQRDHADGEPRREDVQPRHGNSELGRHVAAHRGQRARIADAGGVRVPR
jgi:phosphomannomutase/phosphoglucomutase